MSKNILISGGLIGAIIIAGAVFLIFGKTKSIGPGNTVPVPSTSQNSNKKTYTLAEVATHKNNSSCWTAINGKVYDLTSWINRHPGGPERILNICGTDATDAFNIQH